MGKYLKKFGTHAEYEAYSGSSSFLVPNVSICTQENDVHYTPFVETRVVAKFNVTSTSSPTPISFYKNNGAWEPEDGLSGFTSIEIDGVKQPSVVSAYTFTTTGEHTVKYTLKDPTIIGDYAFYYCTSLTSITIPNSVTSIGYVAFEYCSGLTSIVIPSGVTRIGSAAFASCTSLTSIDIPNSVTEIFNYTFSDCSNLISCTIGSGVTSIGSSAFEHCGSLTSITSLRTTAPEISKYTFEGVKTNGTLYVPTGSSGYDTWMGTSNYYLGKYNWTKVEQ